MTRIPSKTGLTLSGITNLLKVLIPTADTHVIDGDGKGVGRHIDLSILRQSLQYSIITASSHGLVSGDVGKPLNGTALIDDTNSTHYPSGVLVEVIDTNTIRLATPGSEVTLPVALLSGGNAYSIASSGRYVFWDASAPIYQATLPADSHAQMPEILELISVGATTFNARVRCY